MDKESYIEERLEIQIEWYDTKSQTSQKWHKSFRATEIVSAAIIPFVAGFWGSDAYGQLAIGALGVVIAICAGLSALNKYQENWLMYRTTCETLRHEKFLFLTGSSPYKGEDKFNLFVERIENLISKENSQWSRFNQDESHNKALQSDPDSSSR